MVMAEPIISMVVSTMAVSRVECQWALVDISLQMVTITKEM
jgi:hypothetical protein